jgi:transposase
VAGSNWRAVAGPARPLRPVETVASRFYRWRRRGVWDRVLAALQAEADARGELDWLLHFVDGSVVRATSTSPVPAGGRPSPTWPTSTRGAPADPDQPGDRDREALGRSRGGYSTKLHVRVEGRGRPMVLLATAGQRHEAPMLRPLMEGGAVRRPAGGRPRLRPDAVAGDKGYSHLSLRRDLRRRGIRTVIPSKSDQPRQPRFDKAAYRQRNQVERSINRLKGLAPGGDPV